MTDPSRDSILSRIRKLAAVTESRGASETEAMFAAKKLAELMAEHQVDQTELSIRADAQGCIADAYTVMAATPPIWTDNCAVVAKLFKCRAYREVVREDTLGLGIVEKVTKLHIYGFPLDVEATLAMLRILHLAHTAEEAKYIATTKRGRDVRSFALGMKDRIRERIKELSAPAPSTSTALIVLKDQLVTQEYAKYLRSQDIRLVSSHGRSAGNAAAYASGQAAGSRTDLGGRKVSAGLRIGHGG